MREKIINLLKNCRGMKLLEIAQAVIDVNDKNQWKTFIQTIENLEDGGIIELKERDGEMKYVWNNPDLR